MTRHPEINFGEEDFNCDKCNKKDLDKHKKVYHCPICKYYLCQNCSKDDLKLNFSGYF